MASCETCRFMRGAYMAPASPEHGLPACRAGFCHFDPPTLHSAGQSASFRPVNLAAWCGRYRFSFRAWWRARRQPNG